MSDKEFIASLLERIAALEALVLRQAEEIAALKDELAWYKSNRNSHNSHLPPSRDLHKPTPAKPKRKKSSRNPGGQHGHKANRLEKVEAPHVTVVHNVSACQHCGEDLRNAHGEVIRTAQIFDIPKIELRVTEHHKVMKGCPKCGQHTSSELPGTLDFIDAQYGDNLKSLVSYLSSRQYCSVGRVAECVHILTGARISTGFVWDTIHQKAQQLQAVYDQIRDKIRQSPVVGSDETGCRINGKRNWMWVWCTPQFNWLTVSDNRGYATVMDTLGDREQPFTLVSDCYAAQLKTPTADKQICLAHLLRECDGLHERYRSNWALRLKTQLEEIIRLTRMDTLTPQHVRRTEEELLSILKRVRGRAHEKVEVFRDRLYKLRAHITACLRNRLVPPTNNMSERALRSTKVKMRVSSQFRTSHGAQDYAILRSIIDTAILQGRHPFDALVRPEIVLI